MVARNNSVFIHACFLVARPGCDDGCLGVLAPLRQSRPLELRQPAKSTGGAVAAHLKRRLQLPAHARPLGLPKNQAVVGIVKLHATHACRFATGHTGDGGADGRRDAAGTAARSAVHGGNILAKITMKYIAGKAANTLARSRFNHIFADFRPAGERPMVGAGSVRRWRCHRPHCRQNFLALVDVGGFDQFGGPIRPLASVAGLLPGRSRSAPPWRHWPLLAECDWSRQTRSGLKA